MLRWETLGWTAVAALGTWGAACGGSVTFEPGAGGDGGSGGSGATGATAAGPTTGVGASGATGGTTSTTTSSSSTGVGGGTQSICEAFCINLAQCEAGGPSCLGACISEASGRCGSQWLEAADCYAKNALPPSCNPVSCGAAFEAFSSCSEPEECTGQGCFVGPDSTCGCSLSCFGTLYDTSCQLSPNGPYQCDCFIDGNLVGQCPDFQPASVCDVESGCCSQFFFAVPG